MVCSFLPCTMCSLPFSLPLPLSLLLSLLSPFPSSFPFLKTHFSVHIWDCSSKPNWLPVDLSPILAPLEFFALPTRQCLSLHSSPEKVSPIWPRGHQGGQLYPTAVCKQIAIMNSKFYL